MGNFWHQLGKFLVSVLTPLGLGYVEPAATLSTKSLLAMGIYLVWSSLEILYYLRNIQAEKKREIELWSMEHELEIVLNNIRTYYRRIVQDFYGPDDLFKDYFHGRLAEFALSLQSAADHKELLVTDFHFRRIEPLLGAFASDATGILRYVWIIHKGESLFDEEWRQYCDKILKGANQGAIKGVRALLVLGEGVSRDDKVVQGIAGFYEHAKGHTYKVMPEETYKHLKSDHRLEADYVDFGIYGQRYIYLTLSYDDAKGKFCKDSKVIDRYIKYFDIAWNSHSATKLPKSSLQKIKLEEFFSLKW